MDNFCPRCGLDLRVHPEIAQPRIPEAAYGAKGLGRNTVVYLTKEGLRGVQIQPVAALLLAFVIPMPFLAVAYYMIQAGALVLYATLWIAASGLIYDELRWRGLRSLDGLSPDNPPEGREFWLVNWNAIQMADWNGRTLWLSSTGQRRKLSITFDRKNAPSVEQSLSSSGVRYSWRGPRLPQFLTRFSTLAILTFVISQVILILAATLPFFPGEEQAYTTVLNNTQSQVVGTSFLGEFRAIFLNNIQVAWGGAVPLLGTFAFGLASYGTGRVIQVIAIEHSTPSTAVLLGLYILPHTWIEESAYPIAAVAGILGVTKWRSVAPEEFARRWNWGSTKLILALAGAGLILIFAGFIETLTTYVGYTAIAIWVPIGAAYYLLVKRRRRRKNESAIATS